MTEIEHALYAASHAWVAAASARKVCQNRPYAWLAPYRVLHAYQGNRSDIDGLACLLRGDGNVDSPCQGGNNEEISV